MTSKRRDPGSIDSVDNKVHPPSKSGKLSSQRPGGRRTHRACDRCRVKKSKCNGQQPCNTCKANERTCVFSALRRRDIRKWHCHMQDTVDEAIQRLYHACKESASFPGILPDENDGHATTESILRGMGFSNLDLGPKIGGPAEPGLLKSLSLRTNFTNIPSEPSQSHSTSTYAADNINHNANNTSQSSNTDDAPIDSATSAESPYPHPYMSVIPTMSGQYPQRSPVTPLSMSDQFHEVVDGSMRYHPQYHHHHHPQHQNPTPGPGSPRLQHAVHLSLDSEPHGILLETPAQLAPSHTFVPPYTAAEYRERYSPHPYYMYDGGSYINPHQIWPRPPTAMVPQ